MTRDEVQERCRALIIGPLPPPLHGMSLATEALADHVDAISSVTRIDVGPGKARRTYHVRRIVRVAFAVVRVIVNRRRARYLYLACDGGAGMLYSLVLVAAGRIAGYEVFLHHHSYVYISHKKRLMTAIVRAGGARCHHIVACTTMARDLRDAYGPTVQARIVSVAYALPSARDRHAVSRPLRLGHLSNLSVEKGLAVAIATADALGAEMAGARLVLAGPATSPNDRALIEAAVAGGAEYWGPATEEEKHRFYSSIDVFLFPSRYRHESFGLVAWEAAAHGVPVIAFRNGCLTQEALGDGGLVLEPNDDFVDRAVGQLREWARDPALFQRASACATRAAARARDAGNRQLDELARLLAS